MNSLARALALFPLEDQPDVPERARAIEPLAQAIAARERGLRQQLAAAIARALVELGIGRREVLIVMPYLAAGADLLAQRDVSDRALAGACYEIEANIPPVRADVSADALNRERTPRT
jgi:hypothetical protein